MGVNEGVNESDNPEADGASRSFPREILGLGLLAVLAIAGIILTRAAAQHARGLSARDAAFWYARGRRALEANQVDEAVGALRRATLFDPTNRAYLTTLARALAAAGRTDEARRALLELREVSPEDPEVNTNLARLAAARGEVGEAVRYYHSAIYGVWPHETASAQRRVRLELIRFLLDRGDTRAATAELLALASSLPAGAAGRAEAGHLLLEAGAFEEALEQFTEALRLEPDQTDALVGAGLAEFRRGNYAVARRYFRRAPELTGPAAEADRLAALVLANDPGARHLTLSQRRERLARGFDLIQRRLDACLAPDRSLVPDDRSTLDALRQEVAAFAPRLGPRARRELPDLVDGAVELIVRVEQAADRLCGAPSDHDRAWLLIGRRYATDRQ